MVRLFVVDLRSRVSSFSDVRWVLEPRAESASKGFCRRGICGGGRSCLRFARQYCDAVELISKYARSVSNEDSHSSISGKRTPIVEARSDIPDRNPDKLPIHPVSLKRS
jgi:hypothetical protein